VVGNNATIGGEITKSDVPFAPEGTGVILFISDNGEPGDTDFWGGFFTGQPADQNICFEPFEASTSQRGNFVVHDAS
jgi:hypothetical protein